MKETVKPWQPVKQNDWLALCNVNDRFKPWDRYEWFIPSAVFWTKRVIIKSQTNQIIEKMMRG